jgi:hypothetical protein
VLERVAERSIPDADALVTLTTLSRVGDIGDALRRGRSRWRRENAVLGVIAAAVQQAGVLNTSRDYPWLDGYEALA